MTPVPAAVVAVYPSGATVPERLLRVSVRFASAPPPGVRAAVVLHDDAGRAVPDALLPDALWSPDGRLLTLLFRPGRVKTGLRAHDQAGFALVPGHVVALAVGGTIVKRWRVVAGGCAPLDPATWRVRPPDAGTRAPLVVRVPGALDVHATALLAVADQAGGRVAGRAQLRDGERTWTFTPGTAWRRGAYTVRVHPRAETPCGDEPGDAFEHPAGSAPPGAAPDGAALPFTPAALAFVVGATPARPR